MRIPTIAAVFLATACTSCNDDQAIPPDPSQQGALLDRSAGFAGRPVAETTDGPWVMRSTAGRHDPADEHFDRGGEADGSLAMRSRELTRVAADEVGFLGAPTPGAPAGEPATKRGMASNANPLRAGSTDDNDDFDAFVAYLGEKEGREDIEGRWQPLDIRGRRTIRVVDAGGAPLPGLRLQVVDEGGDRVAWRGTTQGDGRVPFYPGIAKGEGAALETVLIEVEVGGESFRQHWDLSGDECVVRVAGVEGGADAEVALDVVFVIDTTGSMGDEIGRIKATLLGVTDQLRSLEREFTLRYGAVLYRDIGDLYVTSEHAFTDDLEAFAEALQKIEASGGGDGPESLNQGLAVAVDEMDWRPGAARVAFLIADAPPHMDYENDVPYGDSVVAAIGEGIRIHAVAASGLEEVGSLVFRQIAQATRGEFVFIEYGGDVAASGEAHGVAGAKKANNLDDILFAKIRDEIASWGRDA